MTKKCSGLKALLIVAACGGIPLVTTATCDPYYGTLDFFRDDDAGYYGDGYYYEDPFFFEPICGPFFCY